MNEHTYGFPVAEVMGPYKFRVFAFILTKPQFIMCYTDDSTVSGCEPRIDLDGSVLGSVDGSENSFNSPKPFYRKLRCDFLCDRLC